jgi:uncharacterized protein with HEPN domain
MRQPDATRLRHMIEAADTVARLVEKRRREDLDLDQTLALALTRAIEIFGEAASRTSAELQVATPQVPWSEIIGMRNRLVHAYFDIDHDIVWKAATEEIPALLPPLRALLPKD